MANLDACRKQKMDMRVCALCNKCVRGGNPPKARCDTVVGSYAAAYGAPALEPAGKLFMSITEYVLVCRHFVTENA